MAARQQGLVSRSEIGVAVDRGAAEMRAVIAFLEAQELGPPILPPHLVILAGEAERDLNAVRPTGGEEGAGEAVWCEKLPQHPAQLDHRVIRRTPKGRIIGHDVQLRRDGLLHRLAGKSEIDVPESADRVDGRMPVHIGDPNAFRLCHDSRRIGEAVGGMRHRMPHMAGVVFLKEVGVLHRGLSPASGRCIVN